MNSVRLFIAINFSADTRKLLLSLLNELRDKSSHGNFSSPENLHLTLAFLGDCDIKQAAIAKSVLQTVLFDPITVKINRIGNFKRDNGDIWWAGIHKSESLINLQLDLTDKLIAAGFNLERRKYNPHITLGRKIVTNEQEQSVEPFYETVITIELMKSERINGKLKYTAIAKQFGGS